VRIRTLVRTSSALVALPLGLAFALFYYSQNSTKALSFWPAPWGPALVAQSVQYTYAWAYGMVAAAAAWQSTRLREAAVWQLAPYQPRWRIIATALAPAVGLGWLMFLVPVIAAFAQYPTAPTWSSLPPLFLGMALTVAYAVIGFTVGRWVKPLIAVPVLLGGIFIVVAFPVSVEPFCLRYMSGEYFSDLGYAESATWASILGAFLPTAGVAIAAALTWARLHVLLRALLALVIIPVTTLSSYEIVKGWDANPSLNVDAGPILCRGAEPRVCIPKGATDHIDAAAHEVDRTYAVLLRYGVIASAPRTIRDQIAYGRFSQTSTSTTKYREVAVDYANHTLVTSLVEPALRYPCERPNEDGAYTVAMWLGKKLGQNVSFANIHGEDPYYSRSDYQKAVATANAVSAEPISAQRAWYKKTLAAACRDEQ
jgi:hypothetical protein